MKLSLASFLHRIPQRERAFFVRQMSIMISSGISIASAVSLISQQTTNRELKNILRTMTKDIESGHPFSVAAARFPDLFDPITLAMIKTGEASGQMNVVVEQMAEHVDKSLEFGNKVRNAFIYPTFIIIVMIIVGILLTTLIIPRLTSIFEESSVALPITTRILIGFSNFMLHYWYILPIVGTGLFFGLRSFLATPEGREALYRFTIRVPIVKNLISNSYLARFTRVLAMLIKTGVPFTEALRIVAETMANDIWRHSLLVVREEVERGIPLSVALGRHSIFPGALTQMVSVGEQTGKLDTVLDNMAKFYENETNTAVKAMTTLIEPIILLVVAIGVGFVVIAVIVPIYGLAQQF
jgi:type IV pilus assembly protein PilC